MQNIKIGTKIILVVLFVSLISLSSLAITSWKMAGIDTDYSGLLSGPAVEALALARANRMLAATRGDTYGMLAETTPDRLQKLSQNLDDDARQFHAAMEDAKAAVPENAASTEAIATEYDRLFAIIRQVAQLASAGDKDKATVLFGEQVRPALNAAVDRISDYADAAAKTQDERSRQASDTTRTVIVSTASIALVGLLIGLVLAVVVARFGVVMPIKAIAAAMHRIAGGDKTVTVPGTGRGDEVGQMAGALAIFKENLLETDRLREEQEAARKRNEAERRQMMLNLADRLEQNVGGIVQSLNSAASEMHSTAQSMSATAEETSRQAGVVGAASEETSRNVQTVASATEELSASITEIGNRVTESNTIVGEAVSGASDANIKMQGLAEAAQKIGDVVSLINDIASQTNLLALNATIEAARAGEAGKGFAVVASEVKALATQTARATDEIASQVRSIQTATTSSVEAIENITRTVGRVSEISTIIASAVEEQGSATQEISRNIQQASVGTQEVSSNITGVTEAAQATGSAATQVLGVAAELGRNGAALKTQMDEFLSTVRAA